MRQEILARLRGRDGAALALTEYEAVEVTDDRPGKELADQPSGARLRTPTALAALLGVGLLGARRREIARLTTAKPTATMKASAIGRYADNVI